MKVDVLLGLQWGDEGKGKIVDVITPDYEVIARFQGGPNAGHTLIFNDTKHVLHTIPSGIFRDNCTNIIGNGVVIDPIIFKGEIEKLVAQNVPYKEKIQISKRAHLILPTHRMLDAASELAKGKQKIGSTLKGIGPTYMDKTGRNGLRIGDLLLPNFKTLYEALRDKHSQMLKKYNFDISDLPTMEEQWMESLSIIKELPLIDSERVLNDMLKAGKRILAEGAQGSLLDIDFGTYPFVTSSNTISAGACTGLGIAPNKIGEVYGIFKAYCTRVGSGVFPTELFDQVGATIAKVGNEFGATTGRPRRCGWLDLPALKYAIDINGVTQLIMMKSDVLSAVDEIKVCIAYQIEGNVIEHFPYEAGNLDIEPIYKTFPSWKSDLTQIRDWSDFPKNLTDYINFLEAALEIPIKIVSVGPDRNQTIRKA